MKIKTNFDILDIIDNSKNGISGGKLMTEAAKEFPLLFFAPIVPFTLGILKDSEVLTDLIMLGGSTASIYVFSSISSKFIKQDTINKAEDDLQKIVNELVYLEVKTSKELLKESKVNEVDYKIEYVDNSRLPKLKQYKYIDIPLSNGYEETLLQEHVIGDKNYELSVNSPIKKENFKLVKNNI